MKLKTNVQIVIDRRCYFQAVRDLLMNKSGDIYVFDDDLSAVLQPQKDNKVVVDNPIVAGIKLSNCYFEMLVLDDKVFFSNFSGYDEGVSSNAERYVIDYEGAEAAEHLGDGSEYSSESVLSFEQILKKYLSPIPKEMEKYLSSDAPLFGLQAKQADSTETSVVAAHKKAGNFDCNIVDPGEKQGLTSMATAVSHQSFLKRNAVSEPSLKPVSATRFSLRTGVDSQSHQSLSPNRSPAKSWLTPKKNRSDPALLKSTAESGNLDINSKQILKQSLKDSNFILDAFNQFGEKKKQATVLFFKSLEWSDMMKLLDKQNKLLGDNVIKIMCQCFDNVGHPPSRDDFSVCFNVFSYFLRVYKKLPEFLCRDKVSLNFLMMMEAENVSSFVSLIDEIELNEALRDRVLALFVTEQQCGFACRLLTRKDWLPLAELVEGNDPVAYYFSLLKQEAKKVDLALLARPKFIEFISAQRSTAIGSLVYAQLLERIKSAFDYSNLPDSYSEVRQTSAGSQLLIKNREKVNKLHQSTMLSNSEVVHLFMTLKPINRIKFGEMWLRHYRENLSLIMKHFLPHLPAHLHEISRLYAAYQAATIGVTASTDRDRYDPCRHIYYPNEIIQYINPNGVNIKNYLSSSVATGNLGLKVQQKGEELSSDLKKLIINLRKQTEFYAKMSDYDTIRMNGNELVGFVSTNRIAGKIVSTFLESETVPEVRAQDSSDVDMITAVTPSDESESQSRKASLVDKDDDSSDSTMSTSYKKNRPSFSMTRRKTSLVDNNDDSSDSVISAGLKKIRSSFSVSRTRALVTVSDLALWISEAIINCCQQQVNGFKVPSNLYTSSTAENVLQHQQVLWLKSYLVPDLERRLLDAVDVLKANSGSQFGQALNKTFVTTIVEYFYQDFIAVSYPTLK